MADSRTKSEGFILRLPDGMRDSIKEIAIRNERSMNAEIVFRLKQWLQSAEQTADDAENHGDR